MDIAEVLNKHEDKNDILKELFGSFETERHVRLAGQVKEVLSTPDDLARMTSDIKSILGFSADNIGVEPLVVPVDPTVVEEVPSGSDEDEEPENTDVEDDDQVRCSPGTEQWVRMEEIRKRRLHEHLICDLERDGTLLPSLSPLWNVDSP